MLTGLHYRDLEIYDCRFSIEDMQATERVRPEKIVNRKSKIENEAGVPSRTLTGSLTLRTRPLCVLSYGDKKLVRASGNAPELGTHLVRLRL